MTGNCAVFLLFDHRYTDIIKLDNYNRFLPWRGYHETDKKAFGDAVVAFHDAVEACHYIRVDRFDEAVFESRYPEFGRRMKILQDETGKDGMHLGIPTHLSNIRRQYKGLNAYSGFNYNGAFDIADKKVDLPVSQELLEEATRGLPPKYVTVNVGSGECKDGSKVAKTWPAERFEKVMEMFKAKYGAVGIVQIGAGDSGKLEAADAFFLGKPMEQAVAVLKKATFHLDIEGGLVHIASQLGTKCFVLFGPTVAEYYGYENNTNIRAGNCHNCWAIYPDVYRCARDMKEPECMYGITPEMVFEEIDIYMKED